MSPKKEQPSAATLARRKNARERRDRVLADGGRRLELLLLPDAAKALTKLERDRHEAATVIIAELLIGAANRKRRSD